MDTTSSISAATLSAARLLIHADDEARPCGRRSANPFQRLRALYSDCRRHNERAQLCLQIDDLQGRQVLSVVDAGPLIDVPLPAGTYHVRADLGDVRRSYTMTLGHGMSFDLYLHLVPEKP